MSVVKKKHVQRNGRKVMFTIDDLKACWDEALSCNSKKFKEWLQEYKYIKNIK